MSLRDPKLRFAVADWKVAEGWVCAIPDLPGL
jgi:hypothetical protein